MATEKRGFMKGAYELKTPSDNRAHYDGWAATYEDSMREYRYVAPPKLAALLAKYVPGGEVLDVGCGTGLAAVALKKLGEYVADGADISPQMLARAKQKNAYRNLRVANLREGLDIASDSYDAAMSAGTFTVGHVGPECLPEVLRVIKPGGVFAFTVNEMVYEKEDYPAHLARREKAGEMAVLEKFYDSYMAETDNGGFYLALRRPAL